MFQNTFQVPQTTDCCLNESFVLRKIWFISFNLHALTIHTTHNASFKSVSEKLDSFILLLVLKKKRNCFRTELSHWYTGTFNSKSVAKLVMQKLDKLVFHSKSSRTKHSPLRARCYSYKLNKLSSVC